MEQGVTLKCLLQLRSVFHFDLWSTWVNELLTNRWWLQFPNTWLRSPFVSQALKMWRCLSKVVITMASKRTEAKDMLGKSETYIPVIIMYFDSLFPAAWATARCFVKRVCPVRKTSGDLPGWKSVAKLSLVSAAKNERHIYGISWYIFIHKYITEQISDALSSLCYKQDTISKILFGCMLHCG